MTALLFQKKELEIKAIRYSLLDKKALFKQLSSIRERLNIAEVEQVEEVSLRLSDKLPSTVKRCVLEVGDDQVNYLVFKPE